MRRFKVSVLGALFTCVAASAYSQTPAASAEMDGHIDLIKVAYACDDQITYGVAVRSAKRLAQMSFPGQEKLQEIIELERSLEDGVLTPDSPDNCERAIEDAKLIAYPLGH